MTSDFTEIKYWFDILIKAAIGVLISIIGLDYRAVKSDLHELQMSKYTTSAELQVVQSELTFIKTRLDRIESKLDKVLSK